MKFALYGGKRAINHLCYPTPRLPLGLLLLFLAAFMHAEKRPNI